MSKPLQAIIVGAGHRAQTYANYALSHPEQLQIVGVADPTPLRRQQTAAQFNLRPEQCYESAEALAALPQCADFITNGTMDHQLSNDVSEIPSNVTENIRRRPRQRQGRRCP